MDVQLHTGRGFELPDYLRKLPTDFMQGVLSDSEDEEDRATPAPPRCERPDVLAADKGALKYDIDTLEVRNACVSSLPRTRSLWSLASAPAQVRGLYPRSSPSADPVSARPCTRPLLGYSVNEGACEQV